jgi:hypothetical protein
MDNPLISTQASPGMGQSTLIDALTSLSHEQIAQMSPTESTAEFHRAVSESIRVTIAYDDYQPVMDLDLKHPVAAAGFRILHSYVFYQLENRSVLHLPWSFD